MEDEELFIAERLDVYLLVSAADEGAQFVAQHLGIATSDDDVGVWFWERTPTAPPPLTPNFLAAAAVQKPAAMRPALIIHTVFEQRAAMIII